MTDRASEPDASPAGTPELSYEAARDELVEVVRRLESGGSTLEESLALWERGEALAAMCQTWLDGAKQRLATYAAKDVGQGNAKHAAADSASESSD